MELYDAVYIYSHFENFTSTFWNMMFIVSQNLSHHSHSSMRFVIVAPSFVLVNLRHPLRYSFVIPILSFPSSADDLCILSQSKINSRIVRIFLLFLFLTRLTHMT